MYLLEIGTFGVAVGEELQKVKFFVGSGSPLHVSDRVLVLGHDFPVFADVLGGQSVEPRNHGRVVRVADDATVPP